MIHEAVEEVKETVGNIESKKKSYIPGRKLRKTLGAALGFSAGLSALAMPVTAAVAAPAGLVGYQMAKEDAQSRVLRRAKDNTELALYSSTKLNIDHSILKENKQILTQLNESIGSNLEKKKFIDKLPALVEQFKTDYEHLSPTERNDRYMEIQSQATSLNVKLPELSKYEKNFTSFEGLQTFTKNISEKIKSAQNDQQKEQLEIGERITEAQKNYNLAQASFNKNMKKAQKRADKASGTTNKALKEKNKLLRVAKTKGIRSNWLYRKTISSAYKLGTLGLGTTYYERKKNAEKILYLSGAKDQEDLDARASELKITKDSDSYKRALKLRKADEYKKVANAIKANIKDKKSIISDVRQAKQELSEKAIKLGINIDKNKDTLEQQAIKTSRKNVSKFESEGVLNYFKTNSDDIIVELFSNKGASPEEVRNKFIELFNDKAYKAKPTIDTLELLVNRNMKTYPNFNIEFQRLLNSPEYKKELSIYIKDRINKSDYPPEEKARQIAVVDHESSHADLATYSKNVDDILERTYNNSPIFKDIAKKANYTGTSLAELKTFYATSKSNGLNKDFVEAYELELNRSIKTARKLYYGKDLFEEYTKLLPKLREQFPNENFSNDATLQDLINAYKKIKNSDLGKTGLFSKGDGYKFIEAYGKSKAFQNLIDVSENKNKNITTVGRIDLALPETAAIKNVMNALTSSNGIFKVNFYDKIEQATNTEASAQTTSLLRQQEIKELKKKFGDEFGSIVANRDKINKLIDLKQNVFFAMSESKTDAGTYTKDTFLAKLNQLQTADKINKIVAESIRTYISTNTSEDTIDNKVIENALNQSVNSKSVPPNEFGIPITELDGYINILKTKFKSERFAPPEGSLVSSEDLQDNLLRELKSTKTESTIESIESIDLLSPDELKIIENLNANIYVSPHNYNLLVNKIKTLTSEIDSNQSKFNTEQNVAMKKILEKRINDLTSLRSKIIEASIKNIKLLEDKPLDGTEQLLLGTQYSTIDALKFFGISNNLYSSGIPRLYSYFPDDIKTILTNLKLSVKELSKLNSENKTDFTDIQNYDELKVNAEEISKSVNTGLLDKNKLPKLFDMINTEIKSGITDKPLSNEAISSMIGSLYVKEKAVAQLKSLNKTKIDQYNEALSNNGINDGETVKTLTTANTELQSIIDTEQDKINSVDHATDITTINGLNSTLSSNQNYIDLKKLVETELSTTSVDTLQAKITEIKEYSDFATVSGDSKTLYDTTINILEAEINKKNAENAKAGLELKKSANQAKIDNFKNQFFDTNGNVNQQAEKDLLINTIQERINDTRQKNSERIKDLFKSLKAEADPAKIADIQKKIEILRNGRELCNGISLLEGLDTFYTTKIKILKANGQDVDAEAFKKKLEAIQNNLNNLKPIRNNFEENINNINTNNAIFRNENILQTSQTIRSALNSSFLLFLETPQLSKYNNPNIKSGIDKAVYKTTLKNILGAQDFTNTIDILNKFLAASNQFGGSSQSKKSTKLSKHRKRAQSIRHGLVSHHFKKSHHLRESKPYMTSAEKRKTMRHRK